MSTWIVEHKRTWPEWVALRILKVGPIPTHLALIMDGNRRFARIHQQNTLHGHVEGFKTLTKVLSWCRDLGITEVTAYAFSIENFKRSKEEVDGLMSMATEKFEQMLSEKEKLLEHGVRIRVIGNLDLLPLNIRRLAAEAMLITRENNKCFLNLAMAYTSREEITTAVKECALAIVEGKLKETDATPRLLEYCLYTNESRHPDLLVRTSGETRLSDFLLWQTQFSCLFFTKVLWPELSIWHVFGAVFHYQRQHHMLAEDRKQAQLLYDCIEQQADLDQCRRNGRANEDGSVSPEVVCRAADARQRRVTEFRRDLANRRLQHLQALVNHLKDVGSSDAMVEKDPSDTRHRVNGISAVDSHPCCCPNDERATGLKETATSCSIISAVGCPHCPVDLNKLEEQMVGLRQKL